MKIAHRVPLIGQPTTGLCWFAAFQMLEAWYNARLNQRPPAFTGHQLSRLKALNWGVKPNKIGSFAAFLGLTIKTRSPSASHLGELLRTYGPLWYPGVNNGYSSAGTHHVVVIRGLAGTDLLVNDPSPVNVGKRRTTPVGTFFSQLQPMSNQFLVMLANSMPNRALIDADLKNI